MTNPGNMPADWNTLGSREEHDSPSSLKYLNESQSLGFRQSQVSWKSSSGIFEDSSSGNGWNSGSVQPVGTSTNAWSMETTLNNTQHSSSSIWTDDQSSSHASFGSTLYSSKQGDPLDHSSNHTDDSFNMNNSFSQLSVNASQHSESFRDVLDPRVVGPPSPISSPMQRKKAIQQQDRSSSYPMPGFGSDHSASSTYNLFNGSSNHTATTAQSAASNGSVGSSVPGLAAAHSGSTATTVTQQRASAWPAPPGFDSRGAPSSSRNLSLPKTNDLRKQSSLQVAADSESFGFLNEQEANEPNSRRLRSREKHKRNRKKGGRGGGERSPRNDDASSKVSLQRASSDRTHWGSSHTTLSEGSTTSEAIRQLTEVTGSKVSHGLPSLPDSVDPFSPSGGQVGHSSLGSRPGKSQPILPSQPIDDSFSYDDEGEFLDADDSLWEGNSAANGPAPSQPSKKKEWLARMTRKLDEIPAGDLDPTTVPILAIMNAWAKTKSSEGASMVEVWLKRAQQEYDLGNRKVIPTTKMYTMAVDAWARSGEGGAAAQHAEALLQRMNQLYQAGGHDALRPTTGIFNAVINAWARSKEKIAPGRAEQILTWMQNLPNSDVRPDKYTFNTVIHAYAKAGGAEAAGKAQELLTKMHKLYHDGGNPQVKPDTITYNVVINCWAKSGGKGAASEAEKLLERMHRLHKSGDPDVKPNVVTYGAVIDSFAKSGERGAAERADALLAKMIQIHQSDPVTHADLQPNTYVFNTVINCWAKSKEHDAASKAEEMLVAMTRLNVPNLKPDAFTYTAVIDAWAKSGYRGAATRADQLLDKMEAKYQAGDMDLKPNTFTYNAVINALAKSGEAGAAARAERVLQNMVNRHRNNGGDDVKPTTINFNTVLDAWAKSGGGRAAAERAEEILEWMDRLHKQGNPDVKPDTITFNAVLDAWARSGDRVAPRRAEQILDHMDELYRSGNTGVKPDTYTYNTLINAWAKSGERGAAERAEHVLSVMQQRYNDGDKDFKPNTRTHTSVIDAWAKSGDKGAAMRSEQILNGMIVRFEKSGDQDVKPNVHTANAVCNACAFSKHDHDRAEALQIAFRVFEWLSNQSDMKPDSYTYTILLSVCGNLLPRDDPSTRYKHAKAFFDSCRDSGYVNDYVLRKLRQTVSEDEYLGLVEYRADPSASNMPQAWTRNAKVNSHSRNRKGPWNNSGNNRRRGK